MRFVLASLSLGLFTWLSYMVLTGKLAEGAGSGGKARALTSITERLVEELGTSYTALALLGVGAILSFGIIAFGPQDEA